MNIELVDGWQLSGSAASRFDDPAEIDAAGVDWIPAVVPGTVAQALQAAGLWSIDQSTDFDAKDWWYRVDFEPGDAIVGNRPALRFDGLATLCDIWLNGEKIAASGNMFLPLELPAPLLKPGKNRLYLCFHSLREALSSRKPRPRWKTNLVANQNLRFFRTSLLGRIPGWSPPVAPVGPWRSVSVVAGARVHDLRLLTGIFRDSGSVNVSFSMRPAAEEVLEISLCVGGHSAILDARPDSNRVDYSGRLEIDNVVKWWPHTHGEPYLYPASLRIGSGAETRVIELDPVGFRTIGADRSNGGFAIVVNGGKVFCRGACWTVNDIVSMSDDSDRLREILGLVRRSGANMLRIGGTMVYESDSFYRLCDEFGIMVWQDFQFANMDYPVDDEEFAASVREELNEHLRRNLPRPCMAVHCGGSEIEQQASMMGVATDMVESIGLIAMIRDTHRQSGSPTVFVDSSPTGGVLPISTNRGVSHYFGVGAYLKAPRDVRGHDVRFASECLGFANVPPAPGRDALFSGGKSFIHHPRWKTRTPRDSNTGWDFEDVRDFYLQLRYGLDPVQLRWAQPERYLQLSELVSAEIMARVMQEWRSAYGNCDGALIWFLKDLWPGAGWGIVGADGVPKAAYYLLKPIWQPLALLITDESLNGLHFHVVNETANDMDGSIRVTLLKNGNITVAEQSMPLTVDSGSIRSVESGAVLNGFFDITNSYRFGPPAQDVAIVELLDRRGEVLCDNAYFLDGNEVFSHPDTLVSAVAQCETSGNIRVSINSSHFLYRVSLDIPGFVALDNYFNVKPGLDKTVVLEPAGETPSRFRGYVNALNLDHEARITPPE